MLGWQQQCEHTPPSIPFSCARAGHSSPLQRPVSTHSFSLSFLHTNTQTSLFLSLCNYFRALFPSSLTCHIHFFISSLQPSHPSFFYFLFLPTIFFSPPSTTLHLHCSLPQLLSHLGFICMAERKGCRQRASRASRALLCPSRPGLRFVMLDNTRQCRDKTSAAADKKSLVFSFPFHRLLHFSHGDAEFSGPFLSAQGRGMKIAERKKKKLH